MAFASASAMTSSTAFASVKNDRFLQSGSVEAVMAGRIRPG